MSSWSDREDAPAELTEAVAQRDRDEALALLAEKHGRDYAADVLAQLHVDVERVRGER